MAYFQGGPRPLFVGVLQLSDIGAGALCFGARSGYPPLSSRCISGHRRLHSALSSAHNHIYVLISTAPAPNKLVGVPPAQRCRRNASLENSVLLIISESQISSPSPPPFRHRRREKFDREIYPTVDNHAWR